MRRLRRSPRLLNFTRISKGPPRQGLGLKLAPSTAGAPPGPKEGAAAALGVTLACGDPAGDGEAVSLGSWVWPWDAVTLGASLAESVAVGDEGGEALKEGEADAVGEGVGDAEGLGLALGVWVWV